MTTKTKVIDPDDLPGRVAELEAQLSLTPAAVLQERIDELVAELAERHVEQGRLYAKVDGWRKVHDDLRAEKAALAERVVDAQRAAVRDRGIWETWKATTRELAEELDQLRAEQSGDVLTWPVVRSRPHARPANAK